MDLLIRRPTKKDLTALHRFLVISLHHAFETNHIIGAEAEIEKAIQSKYQDMIKDVQSLGKEQFHLLAFRADLLLGCIGYGPPNQMITQHMGISPLENVELKNAYVHPEFQRSGVGLALLKELLQHLRRSGIRQVYLDCGYPLAQAFWEKQFGIATKVLQDYWAPASHHMIWRVVL